MKKLIILLLLLLLPIISYNIYAQLFSKVYEHPKMYDYFSKHKKIAIIPIDYYRVYKKIPRGITREDIINQEKAGVINAQKRLENFILKRKNKGKISINVQDVNRTNALIKKANINIYDVLDILPEELCEILNVDAVIIGSMVSRRLMSKGLAIALEFAITGFTTPIPSDDLYFSISIYDKDGTKLWNFSKNVRLSALVNEQDYIRFSSKRISKKIPYKGL